MRFMRRFSAKKMAKASPELLERFRDKESRHELFSDFVNSKEDVAQMKLTHSRRLTNKHSSEQAYMPFTESELNKKFENDAKYVKLVMNDCVACLATHAQAQCFPVRR